MGQWAYHSLVSEFLWMGIEPKYAFKLASLRYPDEEVSFKKNKENMIESAEMLMDICQYKYEEFDVNELLDSSKSVIEDIRKRKKYKRVCIYIDGANLLRSYAYINEKMELNGGIHERIISNKIENYKQPSFTEAYPVWYIMWVLVEASLERSLIDKIIFVMCADDKKTRAMLKSIKANFGFDVIIPQKIGKGLKSSSNEDKVLKDLILSDLENDVFDIAILGTGDGNKNDGISFPEIAKQIKGLNKQVIFTGFDLTTNKKIKRDFEFVDICLWALFPSLGGSEILSREN